MKKVEKKYYIVSGMAGGSFLLAIGAFEFGIGWLLITAGCVMIVALVYLFRRDEDESSS